MDSEIEVRLASRAEQGAAVVVRSDGSLSGDRRSSRIALEDPANFARWPDAQIKALVIFLAARAALDEFDPLLVKISAPGLAWASVLQRAKNAKSRLLEAAG